MLFRGSVVALAGALLTLPFLALAQDLPDCIEEGEWDATTDYFDSIKFQPVDYSLSIDDTDLFAGNMVETDTTTDLFSITYHNSYK